ncbi:MAG: carboxypeptidase-like regulatory domain-containing protein, partial [Bacteroidota bacterium]
MKQQFPLFLRFYLLFAVFTWFGTSLIFAQTKHTVSGYITTLSSGEALSSAKVYVPTLNKGALSNSYGFYSLTLPAGIHEVEFRYSGCPTVRKIL